MLIDEIGGVGRVWVTAQHMQRPAAAQLFQSIAQALCWQRAAQPQAAEEAAGLLRRLLLISPSMSAQQQFGVRAVPSLQALQAATMTDRGVSHSHIAQLHYLQLPASATA